MVAVWSRCVVPGIGKRVVVVVVVVLCGVALSACAHQQNVGRFGSATVAADTGLSRQVADKPLFDGQARVAADSSLLQAESSLKIEPGNLFGTAPAAGPRTRIARQSFTQQISSSIPIASSAPLGLSVRESRQIQWWLNANAGESLMRQAQLSWAPAPLRMNLIWSRNESLVRPVLDCGGEGAVGLAAANQGPGVQLRGRNCSVFAARLPTVDEAGDWSAALTWPRLFQQTTLRMTALQPQPTRTAPLAPAPAYELGLTRAQELGAWNAAGVLAMRRGSAMPEHDAEGVWFADASLKRRLGEVDLTASYRTGSGDDWFLPVSAERVERMAVGLGLSRWLGWLPVESVDFALSHQWLSREPTQGPALSDAILNGRLSWRW